MIIVFWTLTGEEDIGVVFGHSVGPFCVQDISDNFSAVTWADKAKREAFS